jgi:hypothetical protein
MSENGYSAKKIWVTEYGAPTNGPGAISTISNPNYNAGPDHVDEALQAEMVSEAITAYKADSWMNGFFWYSYQDLGTSTSTNENFFGLLRADGSEKPSFTAYQTAVKGN